MSELAAIITAGTTLVVALGAGVRFLWNKIEARFVAIDAELAKCHEREEHSQERRAKHLTVIEILWQELQRIAPKSRVLIRAKHHLDELKTIDGET